MHEVTAELPTPAPATSDVGMFCLKQTGFTGVGELKCADTNEKCSLIIRNGPSVKNLQLGPCLIEDPEQLQADQGWLQPPVW